MYQSKDGKTLVAHVIIRSAFFGVNNATVQYAASIINSTTAAIGSKNNRNRHIL